MARVKYQRTAVDGAGNGTASTQVEVRDLAGDLATLYENQTGSTQAYSGSNPFNSGDGDPDDEGFFEFWVEEGTYTVEIGTGTSAKTYREELHPAYTTYKNVATLLASTESIPEGTVVRTDEEGFAYEVAASGASDEHLTTAGGVKLYVQPFDGALPVDAFGAVADGLTDDAAIIQKALDVLISGQSVGLTAGKTYRAESTLLVDGKGSGVSGIGIIGLGGQAELTLRDANVGLHIRGRQITGFNNWEWRLENLRITSTSRTAVKIGGGDTWGGKARDCWIQGTSPTTENVVAITNDSVDAFRDYFITFQRCTIRNGDHLFVIGGEFISGTFVPCEQAVNRIKNTDVDYYGQTEYGIYIGRTASGDGCNGHTLKGLHFDQAQAGAIADIYWDTTFHYVEGVFESGADYWVNFASTSIGGHINCTGLSSDTRFAIDGVAQDNTRPIDDLFDGLSVQTNGPLGSFFSSRRLQTSTVYGFDGRNVILLADDGQAVQIGNYDPSTNTTKVKYVFEDNGAHSLFGSGQATDGSFDITRDTEKLLPTSNQVEVYEAIVYESSGSANNAISKRLVTLYGPSAITDTEIVTQENGRTYGVTITRPSADVIRVSWTGFRAVQIKLLRVF